MSSKDELAGTQSTCLCCCGVRSKYKRYTVNEVETDGQKGDTTDGGNNIKTCICCWFMGCDEEGVYVWLKNLLLLYNFVFWFIGCCFIGLGIYSEVMRQRYSSGADAVFLTPSVILTLIGLFSFIFATLGGVGALRDNICLLKIFIYSVLAFLIIELTCGILALVFKEPAKDFANHYVLKGLATYYDDPDFKDVMDYIQEEFQCCGGDMYRDWEVNIYHNCSSPGPAACGVPYSCCRKENGTFNINSMCGYDTINRQIYVANNFVYTEGCINGIIDFFMLNLDVLAGILLGIFIPQVTGVIIGLVYTKILENMQIKYTNIANDEIVRQRSAKAAGFELMESPC